MKKLWADIRISVLLTVALAVLLCGIYPLAVWAGGRILFSSQAGGSLIAGPNGRIIGSSLLAQPFTSARYFQPRPSANNYDGTNSGGTNLGPTSDKLAKDIDSLAKAYRLANGMPAGAAVPADAVTRSGSGLDPDISVANARLQAARVAAARHLSLEAVLGLIRDHTQGPDLGFLGEPRVNVLLLNVALDRSSP